MRQHSFPSGARGGGSASPRRDGGVSPGGSLRPSAAARALRPLAHALQDAVNTGEAGSVGGQLAPAQAHQVVQLQGAVLGAGEDVAVAHVVDDLLVGHAVVGLQAVREDLPQHHAVGPHIRLGGVAVVEDGLGRHPADGDGVVFVSFVVVRRVDVPGEAEVGDFHHHVLAHQAVPGGQIPVHKLALREVSHAGGHLPGDAELLGAGEGRRGRAGRLGPPRQVAVTEAAPAVRGHAAEELVEVAVGHVFEEQAHGFPDRTHACNRNHGPC